MYIYIYIFDVFCYILLYDIILCVFLFYIGNTHIQHNMSRPRLATSPP